MSLCRQNYHEDCEAGINRQINMELYASYVYQSMCADYATANLIQTPKTPTEASLDIIDAIGELLPKDFLRVLKTAFHFDRDDVALKGFQKFFQKQSEEEREHAEKFMNYQNKRGGRIVLQNVQKPERDDWGSGLEAMQAALALEKNVNQALMDLHGVASSHNDSHMTDFIEEEFLKEQVDSIKCISDYITNLKRVGPGLGEYQFDKETLEG